MPDIADSQDARTDMLRNANRPPTGHELTAATPVLFLDFDGVMHPYDPLAIECNLSAVAKEGRFCWLPLLSEALAPHPLVRIVVTSDWRHFSDSDKLRALLGPLASRFAGCTGLERGFTRADYIHQVVQSHALQYWCALDDDPSIRKAAVEEPRFVACDSATGLSEPTILAAVGEWLRGLPTEFVSE